MGIESYNWDDLDKKAEVFMHKYIPEAVVCTGIRGFLGGCPIVYVDFLEKGNKAALDNLDKEKCFKRLRGRNVGGSRIGRGKITFNADGSLI